LNGLSAINGLASGNTSAGANGLMTTPGGRATVSYIVKCALPSGHSITKQDQYGTSYTFQGSLGFGPGWESGACDSTCQEYVSACMIAHVNSAGFHIPLWLDSPQPNVGWGQNSSYPNQEATFFGNIFTSPPQAYYCDGAGYSGGRSIAAGRVNGDDNTIVKNPFGSPVYCSNTSGNVAYYSSGASTPDGYSQISYQHAWTHPVTTWRAATYSPQFSTDYIYRIYAFSTRANPLLVDVPGQNSNPGTPLDQWPESSNGGGSRLQIFSAASGNWTIRPAWDTNKCVDAGAGANGSVPTIQSCNGGTRQQFSITGNGGYGTVYIKNVASNRCLGSAANSSGAATGLYDCVQNSWQEYRVLASYN
jgi:hypothetical protein